MADTSRRFPSLAYWLAFLLIILFMIGPLLAANIAESVAESHGCALHEGFATSCIIGGTDRGDLLYSLFVMGWLFFVTFPLGFILLVAWGWIRSSHRRRWFKRQVEAHV